MAKLSGSVFRRKRSRDSLSRHFPDKEIVFNFPNGEIITAVAFTKRLIGEISSQNNISGYDALIEISKTSRNNLAEYQNLSSEQARIVKNLVNVEIRAIKNRGWT